MSMSDGLNTKPNLCALMHIYEHGLSLSSPLPPPWYIPVEAPPCNDHRHVTADETNDGLERDFWCDRLLGHTEKSEKTDRHRMVTDNDEGRAFTWS